MKYFVSVVALSMISLSAMAATPAGTGRRSVQSPIAAARNTPSKMASMQVTPVSATVENLNEKSSVRVENVTATITQEPTEQPKDMREKEKAACVQNNIGIGNTFVWASRYSNINDYSTMIEDVENPENNTCFVKVSLKSADTKIDLGDIKPKYFEMGRDITCGSWVDEDKIEKRILDAKKNVRTWATVGGAVGGAALGVGSMELFGNKLIGGDVQGQKDLEKKPTELLRSQLLALKKDDDPKYNEVKKYLDGLNKACNELKELGGDLPEECNYEFEKLLKL